jgi:mRNA interferase HicA
VKLIDLVRHLKDHGCELKRDSGKHTFWWNPAANASAAVPRHREIKTQTARSICLVLNIPAPPGK